MMPAADDRLLVEVWSDVVCPWCYIGKRRLEAALGRFDHRDRVEVVWRSFELDPRAPAEREGDYAERLAAKYGTNIGQARAMIDRMVAAAAGEGIEMRFDLARPGNTFDAHRLLHLGGRHGRQQETKERLFSATFTEGLPIGDRSMLVGLASEVGLDSEAAGAVLDSDDFGAEVRADEDEAARIGVSGVPFFLFDRRYGIAGAQDPEFLLKVLRQTWSEARPA